MKKWFERMLDPAKTEREKYQVKQKEVLAKQIILARYNATLAWNAKEKGVDKTEKKS